jgi:hypothetical protein
MNGITYIAHKEGDELIHYGVKGMRWGVRRAIKDAAISSAIEKRVGDRQEKRVNKFESKIAKKSAKGRSTERLARKQAVARKRMEVARSWQKKFSEGLSDKDIRQGQRQLRNQRIVALLGGGFSMAVQKSNENYRQTRAIARML